MHLVARRTPPYALASLTAFVVVALPAAACACLTGVAMLVLSVLVIVNGAFNGEPGTALVGGLGFGIAAVVGTLAALLVIGALAGLLAGPVLTSIALLVQLVLQAFQVRSRIVAAALFVVAGHVLGLAVAGLVHLVVVQPDWVVAQEPILLVVLYVPILFVCVVVTAVHGSILLAADTAASLARRAASTIREAVARPVP